MIGIIHTLGGCGGTLLSRCLGVLPGVALLSEINPASVGLFPAFDPLYQDCAWLHLLDAAEAAEFSKKDLCDIENFRQLVSVFYQRATATARRLVLRDYSYVDFVGVPYTATPPRRLLLRTALPHAVPTLSLIHISALIGLTRKRTNEVFDQITDFAGIGDFMAEPLRTYSTGMIMRLAFAVAVHLDPEVLLVDEVLAVGDQAFQAKCIDKIREFRRAGKTLLCVSHAAGMVQQLCDRAIWLDHGELIMSGSVFEVTEAYAGRAAAPR